MCLNRYSKSCEGKLTTDVANSKYSQKFSMKMCNRLLLIRLIRHFGYLTAHILKGFVRPKNSAEIANRLDLIIKCLFWPKEGVKLYFIKLVNLKFDESANLSQLNFLFGINDINL